MADIRINALATTAASTASDDFVAVDGSANGTRKLNAFSPTFGGNLTVSGTGTSSVAGPLKLTYGTNLTGTDIGLFATSGGGLYINAPTTKNIRLGFNLGDRLTLDENTATFATNLTVSGKGDFQKSLTTITTESDYAVRIIPSSDDGGLYLGANSTISVIQAIDPNTTWDRNISVQPNGGKFLLGTTTDSSNGKIQLATHTTSAGGIGFGTDTSLYREAAGTLSINHSGGDSRLYFYNAGTAQGRVESASSNFFVTAMAGSLILRSGGATTALTLDSSQRCILAGALRLNNAYTAGAPTATGYVTLQDSAGNTYKVLVGT